MLLTHYCTMKLSHMKWGISPNLVTGRNVTFTVNARINEPYPSCLDCDHSIYADKPSRLGKSENRSTPYLLRVLLNVERMPFGIRIFSISSDSKGLYGSG